MNDRRRFSGPGDLWGYGLEVVGLLRAEGMAESADRLEAAVRYPATTGNEWLGELGLAAKALLARPDLSPPVRAGLKAIARSAGSRSPYRAG